MTSQIQFDPGINQNLNLTGTAGEITVLTDDLARAPEEVGDEIESRMDLLRPWQRRFILALRSSPNIAVAAKCGNIARASAYEWAAKDPLFKALWEEALEERWDGAEDALYTEGVIGRERSNFDKEGKLRSVEHIRDIRAAEILLKANRPQKYRETPVAVNVAVVIHADVEAAMELMFGPQKP